MSEQPFLKSIRPVNLLSFGPNTREIELRPLNILIGPNGCGKSNLIEVIGLLSKLPDREPWSTVIETGGAREWIWKGKNPDREPPALSVKAAGQKYPQYPPALGSGQLMSLGDLMGVGESNGNWTEKRLSYSITLRERDNAFEVARETFAELDRWENDWLKPPSFEREDWIGRISSSLLPDTSTERFSNLPPQRSVLSLTGEGNINSRVPHIRKLANELERISLHRDWIFGSGSEVRNPQPAGLDSYHLERDSRNLAQILKAWRDRGEQTVFDRLVEMLRTFYEPTKDVDTELLGTHLRIMIRETSGFNTPATRLSDGTLRWLTLLIVLLDPTPPPVICIDEPELGLHPDMIPTLSDLLRDASARTQLVLTTHSRDLVECFSEEPENVCVCEKSNGATEIRRLSSDDLKTWRKDYSLGELWSSGQIGGNRW